MSTELQIGALKLKKAENTTAASAKAALAKKLEASDLSLNQKVEVEELLFQKKGLWEAKTIGSAIRVQHSIILTAPRPLAIQARRFTEDQQRIIEREVAAIEQAGVIEDSNSPYASEIVLVKKAARDWRVCIDYRLLNCYTIDDKYPLSPI